jgi:hypothetical protein
MRTIVILFSVLIVSTLALAQMHIVVERPTPKVDTTAKIAAPDTLRRMVLDPSAMVYQEKVDSINQVTEDKIRGFIVQLEHKFEDPQVEEDVGKLIGTAVMEQQMALLDLQVDRAISMKDTLLLVGLETALRELIKNNSTVRNELMKALDKMQAEMQAK